MNCTAEDLGAPDSWEIADLDVAMTCLMLSSKKNPADPSESAGGSDDITASRSSATATSSSSPTVAGDSAGGFVEDVSNQVDQFLRKALQNPQE